MNYINKVLIVEDDSGIALALYKSLTQLGYKVDTAKTGNSGLRKVALKRFDLVILDLGLPDISGLTICKKLRSDNFNAPIIVLTADTGTKTKVNLFDAGANDYIVKPFSLEELQARMRACIRMEPKQLTDKKLTVGELTLDTVNRTVERRGQLIALRRKEFGILEYLMRHPNRVASRASLMNYAWDGNESMWTNTVDVHVKHLRDKVDKPFGSSLIVTVHGLGYKFRGISADVVDQPTLPNQSIA